MPNNNKIAISRGYAIKTADLSIYDRDQSELLVEKNIVVVSEKSDLSKISDDGTMNFQDDRPISPRVNRTTLAGGIITDGLRSGATVPANTPSTNKSMDYVVTNQSNTAMRDGEYNFTTGKFNSGFPEVTVDRPGPDTVLDSPINFLAGNPDLGGARSKIYDTGKGPISDVTKPKNPDDPNDPPSGDNPGCCITYTRTVPEGRRLTGVVTHTASCSNVASCNDCISSLEDDDNDGICTTTITFSPPPRGSAEYQDLYNYVKGSILTDPRTTHQQIETYISNMLKAQKIIERSICIKENCAVGMEIGTEPEAIQDTSGNPIPGGRGFPLKGKKTTKVEWAPRIKGIPHPGSFPVYKVCISGDCNDSEICCNKTTGEGCSVSPEGPPECQCTSSGMTRILACNMWPAFSQDRHDCELCILEQDVYIDNFNNDLMVRRLALAFQNLEMDAAELLVWEGRCETDWTFVFRPEDCALSSLPFWGIDGEAC